jgi:hypothetical protein
MKKLLSLSVIGIMVILFTGCEDENPVAPPVYTSKLIGKWTQVVDTLTAEGRAYWIDPFFGRIAPTTIRDFVNDTVYYTGSNGVINYADSCHYFTRNDSLFIHSRGGMITKADTIKMRYKISNDTLYTGDTISSVGCSIRIR